MSLAQDAIVVRGADGSLHSTAFQVFIKQESSTVMQWLLARPPLQQLRAGDSDGDGGAAGGSAIAAGGGGGGGGGGGANDFTRTLLSTVGILPQSPAGQKKEEEESAVDSIGMGKGPEGARGGAAASDEGTAATVQVYVNDVMSPSLAMAVDATGSCSFVASGTSQPAPSMLAGLPLRPGRNEVRFEHERGGVVVGTVWLWDADATLVVSDVDGTISRSDVKGYVETVHMQRYDHTHAGVCRLYSHLADAHGANFVYLTSRPLSLLPATRLYIANARQDGGQRLPPGPIICSPYSLARVLYKELIEKTIRAFKQDALESVGEVFHRAGRPRSRPVFSAGFGNKMPDALAYRGARIPADAIFIVNAKSEVRLHAHVAEAAEEEEQRRALLRGGASSYYRSRLQELRRQVMGEGKAAAGRKGEGEKEGGEEEEDRRPVAAVERVTMDRMGSIDGTEEAAAELLLDSSDAGPASSSSSSLSPFSSYGDERLLRILETVLARDRAPCHEAFPPAPPAAPVEGDG